MCGVAREGDRPEMEFIMGVRSNGYRKETRNGNVRWIIDFRYRDKHGRTRRCRQDALVQTATGARTGAERLMRYAAEHGTLTPEPDVPTFATFVKGQFVELVMPGFRPATQERYSRLLHQEGMVEQFANKRLDEMGTPEYRALQARIVDRGADPRPHLALLRTVLREGYELGVIREMPRLPRLPPKPRKLPTAPPLDVVRTMLKGSTGWLRTAIALAYFASQRSGEVRAARVMDADFIESMAYARKAYSADVVVTPKNGDERAVPMADPLRPILAEAASGKKPTDRLVLDENGRTPTRQRLYRAFIAVQKRLGISPTWSFHKLRHAFGTHLVQLGANVEAVREMMGHSDLAMTSRYLHATSGDKVQAIDLLEGNWRETEK
jgi:integrase